MSAHYEIERKYLVKLPVFPLPCKDEATGIEQDYLIAEAGVTERVRHRGDRYYHTCKRRVSNICAEERESEITRSEYEELLSRRDPKLRTVRKTRHVFSYRNQIFELDVFDFWKRQAMMEIELESEDTPVELPDFLTVLREVTDDPAYKNRAMARSVPAEDQENEMKLEDYYYFDENEKPLDRPAPDGGYCGILRAVGCVGDSLASGEFEVFDDQGTRHCIDRFDHSWGQHFARMTGNTVYNFSRGGMSAMEYCGAAGEIGYGEIRGWWDKELACNAYIIALGCNDYNMIKQGKLEFGSVDDVDMENPENNKPTFAGYYAKIIQRYRKISPKCRVFLMTNPREENDLQEMYQKQRALLYKFADIFEFAYVIDLYKYAPPYDKFFKEKFFMNGHMNPAGYVITAKFVTAYIDYIIRHNMEDFTQLGMLPLGCHDAKYRW